MNSLFEYDSVSRVCVCVCVCVWVCVCVCVCVSVCGSCVSVDKISDAVPSNAEQDEHEECVAWSVKLFVRRKYS